MRFDQLLHPLTRHLQTFKNLHSIPTTAFYDYLLIRHLADSITGNLVFDRPTEFERMCKEGSSGEGNDFTSVLDLNFASTGSPGKT